MARCREGTGPLALLPGQEVVAVAVATAIPEVCALGGEDVVVVACNPGAAGAGGARQGADGAHNCSTQTQQNGTTVSRMFQDFLYFDFLCAVVLSIKDFRIN